MEEDNITMEAGEGVFQTELPENLFFIRSEYYFYNTWL